MKKSNILFFLVLMVFLPACEKDETGIIYANPAGLIHQVRFDSQLAYVYTYNDAEQVVEEKSKFHYTLHNYSKGRLVSSDFYIDPRIYSSDSHLLDATMNRKEWVSPSNTDKNTTKTYFYDEKGNLIKTVNHLNDCRYIFDTNGRIIRQVFYRGNEQTGHIDFVYDDIGNVIKRLHYRMLSSGEAELQTTTEYEFDNKHNPWKAFSNLMQPGRYSNTNNIIKETYTIHFETDPFTDTVQVTVNSYSYNNSGYPVSKNDFETYVYYE